MQIAKELNYFDSYIAWLAFCGNCTENDYPYQGKSLSTQCHGPVLPITWTCRPRLQPAAPTAIPASVQTELSLATHQQSDELHDELKEHE